MLVDGLFYTLRSPVFYFISILCWLSSSSMSMFPAFQQQTSWFSCVRFLWYVQTSFCMVSCFGLSPNMKCLMQWRIIQFRVYFSKFKCGSELCTYLFPTSFMPPMLHVYGRMEPHNMHLSTYSQLHVSSLCVSHYHVGFPLTNASITLTHWSFGTHSSIWSRKVPSLSIPCTNLVTMVHIHEDNSYNWLCH